MKTIFIFNYITRTIVFICITIASIYFQKPSILWFYLLPALMGISTKESGDIDAD